MSQTVFTLHARAYRHFWRFRQSESPGQDPIPERPCKLEFKVQPWAVPLILYTSWNLDRSQGTGVAVALQNLTQELEAAGADFVFLKENFRFGNFALFLLKRIYSNVKVALRSRRFAREATWMGIDFDGCFLPRRTHYVLNLRSNFAEIQKHETGWMYLTARVEAWLQRRACARASCIITATAETRRSVIQNFQVQPDRVFVIPNGIDPFWKNLPESDPGPEPMILSVAALYPRKGIAYLLQALQILKKRGIAFRHVHIGGGLLLHQMQTLAQELDLGDHVEFTGPISDRTVLADYYRKSWIFCHPCLHEDFGNVFLEAMAVGRPVVAFANSGALEIITEATGIKVPDRDTQALADALQKLLTNADLRQAMGQAGRQAAQQYDWKKSTLQFLDLLQKGGSSNE